MGDGNITTKPSYCHTLCCIIVLPELSCITEHCFPCTCYYSGHTQAGHLEIMTYSQHKSGSNEKHCSVFFCFFFSFHLRHQCKTTLQTHWLFSDSFPGDEEEHCAAQFHFLWDLEKHKQLAAFLTSHGEKSLCVHEAMISIVIKYFPKPELMLQHLMPW